jgi:hypothetical protein
MGEAGRRRAIDLFDERRVVHAVLETYERIAIRKGIMPGPRVVQESA